jgi:hypothetical protein
VSAIVLTWKDQEYRIPAEKAFAVGEQVEDVVSLVELSAGAQKPKLFKIARAYGVMLRFAGCKVSDADVHREIVASLLKGPQGEGAEQMFMASAFGQLMSVLTMGMTDAMGDAAAGEATAQPTTSGSSTGP